MNLIDEYISKSGEAHGKRVLLITLGVIFQCVGILAFTLILIEIIVFLFEKQPAENTYANLPLELLILGSIAGCSVLLGWRLLRGKRRMLLFLRRFGFDEATEMVSYAIEYSVGRTWRVVTLDDNRVSPIGVVRKLPVSFAVATVVFILIFILGVIFLYDNNASIDLDNSPGSSSMIFDQRSMKSFTMALTIGFILLPMSLLGIITMFLFAIPLSAWRAERFKKISVSKAADIERIAKTVISRSKGIFVPRFTVMKVESSIWKLTVGKLLDHVSAVVVDVSIPSGSLLWEIERLGSFGTANVIYVANRHSVDRVNSEGICDQRTVKRWRNLLSDREVITYSKVPADRNKFEHSLRDRLHDCLVGL